MPIAAKSRSRNVVLVHGGFVDGSGWEAVYRLLRKDGFTVSIVQNPTISLGDDVRVTKRVIAEQDGSVYSSDTHMEGWSLPKLETTPR